jgi:hypothetical protein
MIQSFEMFNENIEFKKQPKKKNRKTDVYNVIKDDVIVGVIKWSSRVMGYAFSPTPNCESDVKDFIKELMIKKKLQT